MQDIIEKAITAITSKINTKATSKVLLAVLLAYYFWPLMLKMSEDQSIPEQISITGIILICFCSSFLLIELCDFLIKYIKKEIRIVKTRAQKEKASHDFKKHVKNVIHNLPSSQILVLEQLSIKDKKLDVSKHHVDILEKKKFIKRIHPTGTFTHIFTINPIVKDEILKIKKEKRKINTEQNMLNLSVHEKEALNHFFQEDTHLAKDENNKCDPDITQAFRNLSNKEIINLLEVAPKDEKFMVYELTDDCCTYLGKNIFKSKARRKSIKLNKKFMMEHPLVVNFRNGRFNGT